MTGPSWAVEHHRGTAASFHDRPVPEPSAHALWWFEVERPAVVLGSTQSRAVIDGARAEAADTEIAIRRSGGGAVHLVPGHVTWIDVVLPADDPRWTVDVGRSFHWLGRAWSVALADLGHPGADVNEGPMLRTEWSDLVCFAGLGPGEVSLDGRKVVGISQRRTRTGARFQCALLHQWEPRSLVDLLALAPAERDRAALDLAPVAAGIGDVAPTDVIDRLLAALERLPG